MELTLDQALQKGIEAHKAGKVQEADRYYTAILKANPKHPDANHNMGVLAVGVGKVEHALSFFETALEVNQNISQFWLSYIDALIKLNRMDDARSILAQAKNKGANGNAFDQIEKILDAQYDTKLNNQGPPQEELIKLTQLYKQNRSQQVFNEAQKLTKKYTQSPTLWNLLGASAAQIGNLDNAILAFQNAISIRPDYAEAYNNMGNTLKEQGKLEEAIDAYNKALFNKPDYAKAYTNMGNALKEQGKLEEAIYAYNKAISIKPDFAEAYLEMGITFNDQDKLEEAIEAFTNAVTINPNYSEAFNNMGNILKEQHKLDEAIEAYNKAVSIKPDTAEAWSNGADALDKWNKLDCLEIWLDKAFSSFVQIPSDLLFMKCRLLWRLKKFDEAANILEHIKIDSLPEIRKPTFLHFKAKQYEKLEKFDNAYDCFKKQNLLVKKSKAYAEHNPEQYFRSLRDNRDKLKASLAINVQVSCIDNSEFSPTFLVGFPRSGTTLLDTILRSNSGIDIVEEKDMLIAAKTFLRQNGHHDFIRKSISHQLNLAAQKIYRKEFNKHVDTNSVDKVYIDKLPLNLLQAPLIHQLYPDAKFILALRHPMDTILSCWMQNFKLNAPMANMVDLDRIVEFYCIAMETFKICRNCYNLNVHEIRYEDLIQNFQPEAESVLHFLNLQWEPEMENYHETALNRGRISTPSYSQVVQPIYKDAEYRWLNYRKYLEPYLEQVKPWISEYGYD